MSIRTREQVPSTRTNYADRLTRFAAFLLIAFCILNPSRLIPIHIQRVPEQNSIRRVIIRPTYVSPVRAIIENSDFSHKSFLNVPPLPEQSAHQLAEDVAEKETNDSNVFPLNEPMAASLRQIPPSYTPMDVIGYEYPIYSFLDETGKYQHRVFIRRSVSSTSSLYGFVPASFSVADGNITLSFDPAASFVDLSKEPFAQLSLCEYPDTLPAGMNRIYGKPGLYARVTESGKREYLIYGKYPYDTECHFFLADDNGNMVAGTMPVQ